MNFRGLEVFLAIVDEGTFAGAASVLGLSRSTVTERVAAFELEVGYLLFERSPTRLTAAGVAFEPFARRILGQIAAGLAAVEDTSRRDRSTLRIGFMGYAAVELNAVLLRAVRRALPNTRLTLVDLPLAATESSVAAGRVDVAILRSPIGDPTLRSLALFWLPRVVVTAVEGPFGSARSLTVDDLADATFTGVGPHNSPAFRDFFLLRAERNGEPPAGYLPANTLLDAALHLLTREAVATPTSDVLRVFPAVGLSIVPLIGAPPSAAVAVCRRDDTRVAPSVFMEVAAVVARTARHLVPDALDVPGV